MRIRKAEWEWLSAVGLPKDQWDVPKMGDAQVILRVKASIEDDASGVRMYG